jgi:hypothetical protein
VNELEKLGVKAIIAGRSDPNAPDNDAARMIDATCQYLLDFNEVVASSSAGDEVVSKMTARHPQLGNPYTLWLGAYTQTYAV